MKLSTLNRAIENAIIDPIGVNSNEDFHDLLKIRDEITRLADICEDGIETEVALTSWYAFSNLMNIATYDDFGRIRKDNLLNERRQTKLYRETVRDIICEELTDRQIDGVTDFLADLWDDNEANGSHKADGSFIDAPCLQCDKAVLQDKIDALGDIINKLYHHRGLSADDMSAIIMYIH